MIKKKNCFSNNYNPKFSRNVKFHLIRQEIVNISFQFWQWMKVLGIENNDGHAT